VSYLRDQYLGVGISVNVTSWAFPVAVRSSQSSLFRAKINRMSECM
jgi:hypothetical protein